MAAKYSCYTNAVMRLEICLCVSEMCIQIGICSLTLALCSLFSQCLITQPLHKGLLYVGTQLPALWQTKQAHQTMCWTQQLKDTPPYNWNFLGLSLNHIVFAGIRWYSLLNYSKVRERGKP